jgi:hypothetical protein
MAGGWVPMSGRATRWTWILALAKYSTQCAVDRSLCLVQLLWNGSYYKGGEMVRKDGEIEIDISKDMRLDTDREAEVILGMTRSREGRWREFFFGGSSTDIKAEALNFSAEDPERLELPVEVGFCWNCLPVQLNLYHRLHALLKVGAFEGDEEQPFLLWQNVARLLPFFEGGYSVFRFPIFHMFLPEFHLKNLLDLGKTMHISMKTLHIWDTKIIDEKCYWSPLYLC